MPGRERIVVAGLAVLALTVAGCATADQGGSEGISPSATPTQSLSALHRAEAALMDSGELPAAPPGTVVDAGLGYTAEGDQVAAPWTQVWLCAGRGRPDEGPPTDVEPGAAAAAWGFGTAGFASVDQYAITYVDEESAAAAVDRARAQAESCADSYANSAEYVGEPPQVEVATTPLDGVRVRLLFRAGTDEASDEVSTVMRSGTTVHFMRVEELAVLEPEQGQAERNPDFDGMVDPDHVEELVAAAVASLTG